jgi:hypothetical protein
MMKFYACVSSSLVMCEDVRGYENGKVICVNSSKQRKLKTKFVVDLIH